jgi:hypothetical protein
MTQLKLGIEQDLASAVLHHSTQYNISATCNKCAGVHETGISITIENGPIDKQSIGDFYNGKNLPKTLAGLSNESFSCPLTGRQFIQKDAKQIFLVPTKDRRSSDNEARKNSREHE